MIDIAAVGRVATGFALAAPASSITQFGGGLINETFLVTTGRGDYVLQRINRAVFADPQQIIDNIITVSRHLGGRFVPRLVETRQSGWLVTEGDEVWRAWHRVPGAETVDHVTEARAASAATLLGRFHAGLADLATGTRDRDAPALPRSDASTRPVACHRHGRSGRSRARSRGRDRRGLRLRAARADRRRSRRPGPASRRAQRRRARQRAVSRRRGGLPRRSRHCHADRIVLGRRRFGAHRFDVRGRRRAPSRPRGRSTPSCSERSSPATAPALDGTARQPPRRTTRWKLAGAIVTYEQALRFLTDWIAGDVYYRTTRPGQNLDRARAQLASSRRCQVRSDRDRSTRSSTVRPSRPSPSSAAAASPTAPSVDELDGALFAPEQPAIVRGDPDIGVVATVEGEAGAYVRLLVVDPDVTRSRPRSRAAARRGGRCTRGRPPVAHDRRRRALLLVAGRPEYRDRAAVPARTPPLRARRDQLRHDRRSDRHPRRSGRPRARDARRSRRDRGVDGEALAELEGRGAARARARATSSSRATTTGIRAFCAFEVNRAGFLGPVAARPDLIGRGAGTPGPRRRAARAPRPRPLEHRGRRGSARSFRTRRWEAA